MGVRSGYKKTEVGVIPEEWEVKTLGEVVDKYVSGGTPPTKIQAYWSGDIPWITSADIENQRVVEIRRRITSEAMRDSSTNVVEKGNLLLVSRTGIGKLAIAPCDIAISQDFTGIYTKKATLLAEYLFWFLNLNRSVLLGQRQGTSIQGITRETLSALSIPIPRPTEQQAITVALNNVDGLIDAFDELIGKKRNIKQAAMQQLLTGRKRLPRFSGKWTRWRFDELFEILRTASNPRSDLSDVGDIGYIHYGDIHSQSSPFLDSTTVSLPHIPREKVSGLPLLEDGDLVMVDASEDYEGIGKSIELCNLADRQVVAGLHTILFRGNKQLIADGFKGYLQFIPSVKTSLIRLATGISVYGISKDTVKSVEVTLPPLDEQRAIATILSDMDDEIAALEQKREKLRLIKQGMMQELLTGRVRLV